MNPVSVIYEAAAGRADRPALIDGPRTVSHGELFALADALAGSLARRGLATGSRIGLCAGNSWRHVAAYLAILRAGAVWVPLNPRNGPSLNGDLRRRAGLDLLLADGEARPQFDDHRGMLPLEDWIDGAGGDAPPPIDDDPDADFAIKFTGGSTGTPKGVVQSRRSALAALRSMQAYYRFEPADVNLAVAPLTHGSSHYILPVLAAGGAHVLLARPDRAAILSELKRRITVAFMPPTLIYLLMEEAAFGPEDFPALRHLTWSAAPMPPARIRQAIERFGPVLGALYGQTEAPMAITALTPDQVVRPELQDSAGYPFPGTPVRVLTADGDVAATGEGEILVGGDLAATRYLDDPAATDAARRDGWLRTGDLGRLESDGRLTILGRSREMIISGGYNIYPAEAEAALAGHPAVREACAFGVEDPIWGERLEIAVAFDAGRADAEDLLEHVRQAIGPVRTPKALHAVQALPRNPVGKVSRSAVRDLIYPAPRAPEPRDRVETVR